MPTLKLSQAIFYTVLLLDVTIVHYLYYFWLRLHMLHCPRRSVRVSRINTSGPNSALALRQIINCVPSAQQFLLELSWRL
jgi:hypothetical protein